MGNIGPVKKEIILEPFPEHAPAEPIREPVREPAAPEREKEPVPA